MIISTNNSPRGHPPQKNLSATSTQSEIHALPWDCVDVRRNTHHLRVEKIASSLPSQGLS